MGRISLMPIPSSRPFADAAPSSPTAGAPTLAIEPQAPPEKEQLSPIENEIPAYRAISPMAIGSLVLGLISALSFADTTFLAASVLAVAAGIYAQWKIRKMP